jgi:hypothetical protein
MCKLLLIDLGAALACGCDNVDDGRPQTPESEKVTRPIEIDTDKETLKGRVPPPPHHQDTATSPGQNVPTSKPATNPAPVQ